jgi:hypothetical protein
VSVLVPDWLLLADDEPPADVGSGKLGDALAAVIAERGPSSGSDLASRVGARKATVLRELGDDPRFERVGRGPASRWDVTAQHRAEGRWEPMGTDASTRRRVLLAPAADDAQNASAVP